MNGGFGKARKLECDDCWCGEIVMAPPCFCVIMALTLAFSSHIIHISILSVIHTRRDASIWSGASVLSYQSTRQAKGKTIWSHFEYGCLPLSRSRSMRYSCAAVLVVWLYCFMLPFLVLIIQGWIWCIYTEIIRQKWRLIISKSADYFRWNWHYREELDHLNIKVNQSLRMQHHTEWASQWYNMKAGLQFCWPEKLH